MDILLTVYINDVLVLDPPASSLADPSEVHFVPSTGGLPTPSTSQVPVSSLVGIGIGTEETDTGVHFVPTNTPLPTPTTSVTPVSSLKAIGMGSGVFVSVLIDEIYEVYTTVLISTLQLPYFHFLSIVARHLTV